MPFFAVVKRKKKLDHDPEYIVAIHHTFLNTKNVQEVFGFTKKSFYTGTHLLEPEFERIMWYIEDKTLKKWIVVSNLFFSNKMASFACKSKQNLKRW